MTASRRAHRRFVVPPGRRDRQRNPRALHGVGSSAGCAAVIEARVSHTPRVPLGGASMQRGERLSPSSLLSSYGGEPWPETGSWRGWRLVDQ